MSELKQINFTSLVTKKTRRAKARLLQNFGKADKTTDELFEVYSNNFNRQLNTAHNLQKHVKHYVNCLKELHDASKALNSSMFEMHERDWPKHDEFENNTYEKVHISEDLQDKLKESVLVPLEQYLGQFAEMREKIAKRGRKLVDYDSQRHAFEALQQSMKDRPHDPKLTKSRDQLEEAKRVYETLNSELHEELPALYDNRLPLILTVFQRLFSSHLAYHKESVDVLKDDLDIIDQLAKDSDRVKSQPVVTQATPNQQSSSSEVGKKVITTYRYIGEEEDELSFEANEIIEVVGFDFPEQEEEGWLNGIKKSNGQKGLFPANYTKELKE